RGAPVRGPPRARASLAPSARWAVVASTRTRWLPRRARGRARVGSSRHPRDGVDLDVDALARRGGFDGRPRRLHALEVLAEDTIERVEVFHVAQEHADFDDVGQRRAGRLQPPGDVVERAARLPGW